MPDCKSDIKFNSRLLTVKLGCISLTFSLLILFSNQLFTQEKSEFEEITVSFAVEGIGMADISVLIQDQDIYLPINTVFDFIKINNTTAPGMDYVQGFFISPEDTFRIDRTKNQIFFHNKVTNLKPDDLIRTETNLYLKSNYFGEIFGLECSFNFRSLSVLLKTKVELPSIREMRLEHIRKNMRNLDSDRQADTTIARNHPMFYFGMADWFLNNNQRINGKGNTQINLALGGILAGGETEIEINSYLNEPFAEHQINYLWRYVDNDNKLLRQVSAGKINTQAVSTIYAPVVGVQLTNAPTSFRRSFGFYRISDYTEPGWTVELYANNVLVDYVKADPSGFYTFEVPLIYGNSEFRLRFYGQWGEEKISVQNISIPYNFLPPQEFEYTIGAGVVEDHNNSIFYRNSINYGVNRSITLGGGMEYLSSLKGIKFLPFLSSYLNIASGVLFSGEYMHGVKFQGILNYTLASQLQFELAYTKYNKEQNAVSTISLEERRFALSMPFHLGDLGIFSRMDINQTILPYMRYTAANLILSSYFWGISTNFTTAGLFNDISTPEIRSSLSFSFSLPSRIILRPTIQFDHKRNEIVLFKCEIENQILTRLFIKGTFERNMQYDMSGFLISLRYELPFAQVNSAFNYANNISTLSNSAGGSLIYDMSRNLIDAKNKTSVGKCGLIILPFLDINGNDKKDSGEPRVPEINFRIINGGRIEYSKSDSTIIVSELEPYTSYFIEFTTASFENVAWQIKKPTVSVSCNPNQIKLIEIPIMVAGEISGTVYFTDKNEKKGLGRIIVLFYDSQTELVGRVITETDGYYDFIGLKPGTYKARIDSSQLKMIQMESTPLEISFDIKPLQEGDVISGQDFILKSIRSETKLP